MKNSLRKLDPSVQQYLLNNPGLLNRIEPFLINPIAIKADFVPNHIYYIFDETICGVMRNRTAQIVNEPPNEDPYTFEVQFDDEPVFLSIGKHVVLSRIDDLATINAAFAAA